MRVVQTKLWPLPMASHPWLVACLTALALGTGLVAAHAQAVKRPDAAGDGEEVQTRGPVHEAFAGVISFNPEPGVVAAKPPPEPIEEMPPEEKPEGDNVTWIPGYWSWDDERNDYLWISGTWRALPPGRAWIAGYWGRTGQGYQWTSGYWVDAAQQEATYLPAPPVTIEAGPNVPAPSPDYIWAPGCWVWTSGHYAWRPGYWVVGRTDWDWVPAHYTWTPRGYLYVGGYWDYPVERRGVIFAPVYFPPAVYVRPHFVYSPAVVIDLGVFTDHLFCRPHYHHYYFGDYYAPAYVHGGFYASFSFHIGHHGYDPIYAHHRWSHRHEHGWHHRLEASYRHRRDHEDARPPRTWVQQRNVTVNNVTVNNTRIDNRTVVARTLDQDRQRSDSPVRYQTIARGERQRLVERNREIQTVRQQRQTVEASAAPGGAITRAEEGRPVTAQVPKTTIVAKPVRDLPPQPSAPRPDSGAQTRREAQVQQREARQQERQTQQQQRQAREQERREGRRDSQAVPTPTPTPSPTPAPERRVETPPERRVPSTRQQPQVQTPPQQVQPAPRQERTIPQQQQQQRAQPVPPPQQEQRRAQPVPQQQQRRVPSMPQERRAEPQPPGRMAQSPAVITEESQRSARPVEPPRGNPRNAQPMPRHSGKKGAERLKDGREF